jgi:hypothetical protein
MPFVIEAWGEVEMEWMGDQVPEGLGTASIFIPEPTTAVLLFAGLVGLSLSRCRRPREHS